nr:non-specific lipid-transfer protein 2-like [Ipomoea batatas]
MTIFLIVDGAYEQAEVDNGLKLLNKTNGKVVGDLITPTPLAVRENTNLEDDARQGGFGLDAIQYVYSLLIHCVDPCAYTCGDDDIANINVSCGIHDNAFENGSCDVNDVNSFNFNDDDGLELFTFDDNSLLNEHVGELHDMLCDVDDELNVDACLLDLNDIECVTFHDNCLDDALYIHDLIGKDRSEGVKNENVREEVEEKEEIRNESVREEVEEKAFNFMTLAVLLLLLGEAQFSLATCDAKQLNPCLSALTFNLHPPPQCCERLNQQKPCFCQYVKNPKLKDYLVNSAAAKKVYELCKVTMPKC